MNFTGHAIGAGVVASMFAGGLILMTEVSAMTAAKAGLLFWVAGQVPDLDIGSIPARWFGRIGFLAAGSLFIYGLTVGKLEIVAISSIIGMAALLLHAMRHRGPMHKYWMPAFFISLGVFGAFQGGYYMLAFGLGWIVHLMLDGIFFWNIRKGWLP